MKTTKTSTWTLGLTMSAALLAANTAIGAVVSFSGLNGNNSSGTLGGWAISNPNVTHSITTDGNDNLYNYSVASLDLDGVGGANDTLSWTMRHTGFDSSGSFTVDGNDSSVTLGAAIGADPTPGVNYGLNDGDNGDIDTGESTRWSIENISLTTDIQSFVSFEGFTGAFLTGGTGVDYILGEGASGLTSIAVAANGNFAFDPQNVLTLTTDTDNRGIRNLIGSFEVFQAPEPSSLALLIIGGAMLMGSRRRKL